MLRYRLKESAMKTKLQEWDNNRLLLEQFLGQEKAHEANQNFWRLCFRNIKYFKIGSVLVKNHIFPFSLRGERDSRRLVLHMGLYDDALPESSRRELFLLWGWSALVGYTLLYDVLYEGGYSLDKDLQCALVNPINYFDMEVYDAR